MKHLLLLFSFLCLGTTTFAQTENPDPFYQIVEGMKATDTFMVYGDLCSGCIRGTRERIHVIWKKKGVVWIRSYEYWYQFENVVRTGKVPFTKDPFAFYEANKEALTFAVQNVESVLTDTIVLCDGRVLLSQGFSHGSAQEIYIHYPNQTIETLFCCGNYDRYEKKAPQLVSFFDLFPKELNARFIPINPDPVIYSETR